MISLQPSSREQEAARTIQKRWRRSRAGVALLTKDKDVIAELPHTAYNRFRKLIAPRICQGDQNPYLALDLDHAASEVLQSRVKYQTEHSAVLCTAVPGAGKLPEFRLMKLSELPEDSSSVGRLRLTPEAFKQYQNSRDSAPKDREALNGVVQALAKMNDLFLWKAWTGYCFARARAAIDFLKLCGFQEKDIAKQYVVIPEAYRKEGVMKGWIYHVAPVLLLPDGPFIIDPVIDPEKALLVHEWIAKQCNPESAAKPINFAGVIQVVPGYETGLTFDQSMTATFATHENTKFHYDLQKKTFSMSTYSASSFDPALRDLTKNRLDAEKLTLSGLFSRKGVRI